MKDAQNAVVLAAESLGRDLLDGMLEQFRQMPSWNTLTQAQQNVHLSRASTAIEKMIRDALNIIVGGAFPAVVAEISTVSFGKTIKAKIELARTSGSRHELADAAGTQVIIIMADPEEYFASMKEVRGASDQRDLFFHDSKQPLGHMATEDPPANAEEPPAPSESPQSGESALNDQLPASEPQAPLYVLSEVVHALKNLGVELEASITDTWGQEQLLQAMIWVTAAAKATERGEVAPDFPDFFEPEPTPFPMIPENRPLLSDIEQIVRDLQFRGIEITEKQVKRWSRSQRIAAHSWVTGLSAERPDFLPAPKDGTSAKE